MSGQNPPAINSTHLLLRPPLLLLLQRPHMLTEWRAIDQLHHYEQAVILLERLHVAHDIRVPQIIPDYRHLVHDLAQTLVLHGRQAIRAYLLHGQEAVRVLLLHLVDASESARPDYLVHGIIIYIVGGSLRLIGELDLLPHCLVVLLAQLVEGLEQRLVLGQVLLVVANVNKLLEHAERKDLLDEGPVALSAEQDAQRSPSVAVQPLHLLVGRLALGQAFRAGRACCGRCRSCHCFGQKFARHQVDTVCVHNLVGVGLVKG